MIIFPLYIDPGTGSALFSIAIGIAAAVYFLVRGFFLKFGVLLFRRKKTNETRHKYVIYAEDKRYWAFFEPVLNEAEKRRIEILYLTTSSDDPVFSSNYSFIKGKYIGQGNKIYAYLNFISADFLLTTTPGLDVMQWKRSKTVKHYCHYVHGAGGPSLYTLFSLDYFNSILLSSEIDIPEIRYLEKYRNIPEKQLVVTGNLFFDRGSVRVRDIQKMTGGGGFTVLVSPSWGESALLSIYGEKLLDPLAETGWRIIVRPHPQSMLVEKQMLDKLIEKYKDNPNFEWDTNPENIYSLAKSDVMISDFSGIIYDYIFLFDKPVLINTQQLNFNRLDASYLEEKPFYYNAFSKVGLELDRDKLSNIKNIILDLINNTEYRESRQEVKKIMWQYQGESAKRVVDFMIETTKAISAAQ